MDLLLSVSMKAKIKKNGYCALSSQDTFVAHVDHSETEMSVQRINCTHA